MKDYRSRRLMTFIAALFVFITPSAEVLARSQMSTTPADLLVPFRKGSKWGYSDLKRKIVISPVYDSTDFFFDGLARVKKGQLNGFIDKTGRVVIKPSWRSAGDFRSGRAKIWDKGYGFIDTTGALVVKPIYKDAQDFSEGIALVRLADGKYTFIDTNGNEITKSRYDYARGFSEGLAVVQSGADGNENTRLGFIDKSGSEAIPLIYTNANDFSDGLAQVQQRSDVERQFMYYTGFIDRKGKTVIPFDYGGSPWQFSEGFAFVNRRESAEDFIIDKTGRIVLRNGPDYVVAGTEFHGGLARVFLKNKVGYIDPNGKLIIPLKYDRIISTMGFENGAEDFTRGYAAVSLNAKFALIDKVGKLLTPFKYSSIPLFSRSEPLIYVCVNRTCTINGYVGPDGTEYFEP